MNDLNFRFSGKAEKIFDKNDGVNSPEPLTEGASLLNPESDDANEAVSLEVNNKTDGDFESEVLQTEQADVSDNAFEETAETESLPEAEGESAENSDNGNTDENTAAIIADANRQEEVVNPADTLLEGLADTTQKEKFDFINLCVMAILVLLIGMTFIFMKQASYDDSQNQKLSFETIKTGEYTTGLSESYTKNMPMPKIMAQADVLLRKLFGKTKLEFVKFTSTEPPDGPVDNDIGGDLSMNDDEPAESTSAVTTTTEITTTTGKIKQDFIVTVPEDDNTQSELFTGRPIKTTTSKTTTTLKLPKATDETTTGKVNLILPETN